MARLLGENRVEDRKAKRGPADCAADRTGHFGDGGRREVEEEERERGARGGQGKGKVSMEVELIGLGVVRRTNVIVVHLRGYCLRLTGGE